MATENEIIMAGEAIRALVPRDYGMTWQEAKYYAKAALEAEGHRIETCTHTNKQGTGMISADGSGEAAWWCRDCGKSGKSKWPSRPAEIAGAILWNG